MLTKINWDALGIGTSIACAIHCALLPLIISSLPLFGINIIDNPLFEYGMITLAFLVGAYSLLHGYKKHHHKLLPFLLFSIGMACLFGKQIWHEYHLVLLIPAVVFIIYAHYMNFSLCRKASHCHANDCTHQ